MTMHALFMMLPLMMFGITTSVILLLAHKNGDRGNRQLPDNSPAVTLPVQLIRKQSFVNQTQYGAPLRHFLTFSAQDGSLIELEVPAEAFEAFNEGEYGDLCVQGRTFLGFVPQELPFAQQYPQADPMQSSTFPSDNGFDQGMM